jgi:murein DD-endopeptidase MepM/ murein hydrolase activator NlpD
VNYGAGGGTIDLGNEPPMVLGEDEEDDDTPIPRAVSWRWMTGTVLTGVTSILLMGAALMVAVANPNQFASLPESLLALVPNNDGMIFGRKGDRVHPVEEKVANRQVIQVSTVTRQGERDFIKLKPFAKIHASLSLASNAFASKVPAYDPLKIFADTSAPDAPSPVQIATAAQEDAAKAAASEAPDGEVSVKTVDFPVGNADLEPSVAFDTPEVEQIVRASANIGPDESGDDIAGLDYADPDAPANGAVDAVNSLGVKIEAENVSNIAKNADGAAMEGGYQERIFSVSKAENLRALFQDNAITGDDADEIIAALSQLVDVSRLRPGQKVRVAFASDPATAALDQPDSDADTGDETAADDGKSAQSILRPIRVSIYENGAHQATVARADNNVFVRADEPSSTPELLAADEPEQTMPEGGPPKLYDAVYETALEQQVPADLIDEMIRAFAYDVDFTQRASLGDALELFHSVPDSSDADTGDGELLYAALTVGGATKRLYRYRTPDDDVVDYYDEDGHSAKKFLVRKPLTVIARISSQFGWRVHPILGYKRLHPGVDYAAPRGTPILAAGNGVVERAGPSSGYGNFTLIKHTNGYETAYGHQTAFAKGIKPGVTVRQGQIIGYVGSTGLSTGPHLHFEIRVNGQPVDPLRIRLPRGRVLEGDFLASFEKERERIDTLIGNTSGGPAQKVASAALTD